MYIDKLNEFADAATLTTATGRALVGNVIDLGSTKSDQGAGSAPYLVIQVDEAVTSAGAATVAFELVSDAQEAIATDGSATVHFATGELALANLAKGQTLAAVKLPMGEYQRYLGVIQNVGTAVLTAGKVNAFLTMDVPRWTAAKDGLN